MNADITALGYPLREAGPRPRTPAQERRIQALHFSPEFLDRLDPEAPVRWAENGLPDDATICGLLYRPDFFAFVVLVASASYDPVPEGSMYAALPVPQLTREEGQAPLPFLRQLSDFLRRAKMSVSVSACLEDVIILPRHYSEGLTP